MSERTQEQWQALVERCRANPHDVIDIALEAEQRGYQRCQRDVAAGLRSEAAGHRGHDDSLAGACDDFASAIELCAYVGASESELLAEIDALSSELAREDGRREGAEQERQSIIVWRFHEAPAEYQALSTNGGDEDWVALLPAHEKTADIFWLHSGSSFGCCEVEEHELPDGRTVCIGCHA